MESTCAELESLCRQTMKIIDRAEARGADFSALWAEMNPWPMMNRVRARIRIPDEPIVSSASEARVALIQAIAMIDAQQTSVESRAAG